MTRPQHSSQGIYLLGVLLLLFLATGSCTQEACPNGYQKLDSVASRKMRQLRMGAFQRGGAYRDALFFELLTGKRMHMYLGDITFYESMTEFELDEKQWNDWLNENNCTVSDEKVDSLLLHVIQNTPWISDTK